MEAEQSLKPTVSAQSLFASYVLPQKKGREMGERQQLICKICTELGIDRKYWRSLYFTLLTNKELEDEWQAARSWKINPAALFNKRVRSKNREIKNKLK